MLIILKLALANRSEILVKGLCHHEPTATARIRAYTTTSTGATPSRTALSWGWSTSTSSGPQQFHKSVSRRNARSVPSELGTGIASFRRRSHRR